MAARKISPIGSRYSSARAIVCSFALGLYAMPAGAAEDVTGTYSKKDAEARIHQSDGRIKFFIGATYRENVGEVSGEAPLKGNTANYTDETTDCALSFRFAHDNVTISQDGSCGMGLNVSGAGTYKRVSTAPPEFDE